MYDECMNLSTTRAGCAKALRRWKLACGQTFVAIAMCKAMDAPHAHPIIRKIVKWYGNLNASIVEAGYKRSCRKLGKQIRDVVMRRDEIEDLIVQHAL